MIRLPNMVGLCWGFSSWHAEGHLLSVWSHDLSSVPVKTDLSLSSFSYKASNPTESTPNPYDLFNLYYLLKTLSPNTVTLGFEFQHINLGEGHNPVHSRGTQGTRDAAVNTSTHPLKKKKNVKRGIFKTVSAKWQKESVIKKWGANGLNQSGCAGNFRYFWNPNQQEQIFIWVEKEILILQWIILIFSL